MDILHLAAPCRNVPVTFTLDLTMEYRANLFAAGYFGYFVVALAGFFLLAFVVAGAYGGASALLLLAACVYLRIRARRMAFFEHTFLYDGWLRSIEIPLQEIVRVAPGHSFGYPLDRVRGGQYCIFTASGERHWVSLLLFAGQASRQFHEHLVHGRRGRDEV